MADQTERAFQKQKNVFLNGKQQLLGGKNAKKVMKGEGKGGGGRIYPEFLTIHQSIDQLFNISLSIHQSVSQLNDFRH